MIRKRSLFETASFAFAAAFALACSSAAAPQHDGHDHAAAAATGKSATAELKGKDGSKVSGKVTFKESPAGVAVVADFTGIEAGASMRGFHVHEVGDCTPRTSRRPAATSTPPAHRTARGAPPSTTPATSATSKSRRTAPPTSSSPRARSPSRLVPSRWWAARSSCMRRAMT